MPGPAPSPSPPAPTGLATALIVTLALAAACADRSSPDFRGSISSTPSITVDVRNQNFADVTVYVGRGGAWQRIGDVVGNTTGEMEIPSALISPEASYQFRVHAIGSTDDEDFVSQPVMAMEGDVIVLTVAPALSMSSWSIRR